MSSFREVSFCHPLVLFSVMRDCARHVIYGPGGFSLSVSCTGLNPLEPASPEHLKTTRPVYCVKAVSPVFCSLMSTVPFNVHTFVCISRDITQHFKAGSVVSADSFKLKTAKKKKGPKIRENQQKSSGIF